MVLCFYLQVDQPRSLLKYHINWEFLHIFPPSWNEENEQNSYEITNQVSLNTKVQIVWQCFERLSGQEALVNGCSVYLFTRLYLSYHIGQYVLIVFNRRFSAGFMNEIHLVFVSRKVSTFCDITNQILSVLAIQFWSFVTANVPVSIQLQHFDVQYE